MMRAAAALACLCAAGCGLFHLARPENPCPSVRRIAVPPVAIAEPGNDPDAPVRLGEILGSELVQVRGIDGVVGPRELGSAADPREARAAAARCDVQALLAARVIEWDPYYKPRLAIEVEFIPLGRTAAGARTLIDLDRSAGPPRPAGRDPSEPVRLVRVYDSAERKVMDRVRRYAAGLESPASGMDAAEGVLRIRENYFRFACYEILRDLFAELAALRESEPDGSERDPVRRQERG